MATDNLDGIRRGQATNLAVAKAIQDGKGDDFKSIALNFLFYMQVSEILQKADLESLATILDNPQLIEKLKGLSATMLKG